MAGNLITSSTSKASNLRVETFEFTVFGPPGVNQNQNHKLELENGSHFSLSLKFICKGVNNYTFQLTLGYDNFLPIKTRVEMKGTTGSTLGSVEIIPPQTDKQFFGAVVISPGTQVNWVVEVTYLLPDQFTFAMDYEGKAENLKDLSDFSVICKEKTFPCHKVVLAARSDSLAGLIKDKKNDKVDIKEFAPAVVENMITWMYTDKLPKELNLEDTEELFKIADKYHVNSLRQICEHILLNDLTMDNAVRRLHFAKVYEAEELLEKSLKIVKDNLGKLGLSKEFGILMAEFPYILQD